MLVIAERSGRTERKKVEISECTCVYMWVCGVRAYVHVCAHVNYYNVGHN